ncbi:MAG: DNA-directed RNA polymerase subunit alpha [Candidatus Woesebacteria bacterium]|jgi:DNA-directed RNA polymerase subunit alpha
MQNNLTKYAPMNPTFTVDEVEATTTKARLVFEPLEKGYGHTLGNALRRVLLNSLAGAAVVFVKIFGIDHQFSTLEGMTEDVINLILNIKQIRIKADSDDEGVLRLNVTGAKEVTAADIECQAGFEIVNPDLKIATLAKGKKLELEMIVKSGMGYLPAEESKTNVLGQIPVDAMFSPVVRVTYKVEATRVGRKTDYDRLVMDIDTDGTITPFAAVKQAAQILSKQFEQIVNPVIIEEEEEKVQLTPEEAETLKLTVEELDLPTRIANALRKGGFATVGDLVGVSKSTVAKVKNLGAKSVNIINDALKKKGVSLED